MEKSIGYKKIKIAVFISGKGSNLKNLINHSLKVDSKFKINLIISNNPKAKGLIYAKEYRIKKKIFDNSNNKFFEKKTLLELKKNKINFICLAGFMKILSKSFLNNFKGTVINIHPSLLPKYKGLNTHQRVLDNNEKYSGCTVHFVNSKLDSGKIILQKKIRIQKNETAKGLEKKILKLEHNIYPIALNKVLISF